MTQSNHPEDQPRLERAAPTLLLIVRVFSLLETAVKWGIPSLAAVKIAELLADKDTFAHFIVDVFLETGDVPWELAVFVVLIIWAMLERKLRRRKTASLQQRVQLLEKLHDPRRTSSNLTETGETNPEDRL